MINYISSVSVSAPLSLVFDTVARIDQFSKAIPHIVDVEFLSEQQYGVGTRFKETRLMNGRKASTVLEVTELVANEKIRLVSEAGGTTWDSTFTLEEVDGQTHLQLHMTAKPHHLFARLGTSMAKKMLQKALDQDMRSIKEFCEKLPD